MTSMSVNVLLQKRIDQIIRWKINPVCDFGEATEKLLVNK